MANVESEMNLLNLSAEEKKRKFLVEYKNMKNEFDVNYTTADYVVVASGNFGYPSKPLYPGHETWDGK